MLKHVGMLLIFQREHIKITCQMLYHYWVTKVQAIVLIISHDVVGSDRSSLLCNVPTVPLNRYNIINATHGNSTKSKFSMYT